MNVNDSQRQLLLKYLDGHLQPEEEKPLHELLESNVAARDFLREIAEQAVMVADIERMAAGSCEVVAGDHFITVDARPVRNTWLRRQLALSAIVIVALVSGLIYQHVSADRQVAMPSVIYPPPVSDPPVARITGLSGPLIWRGDGGHVVSELSIGTELAGGTIEGMAPDSLFELAFHDGSSVMIAGVSMLTFSDLGQKELRLNGGNLSASVAPQPEGKPMLIHTRSAAIRVLGTRFEIDAELDSTALHVSEGTVEVRRLSDGRTVDVPAKHRVVATVDGGMQLEPTLDAVHDWKSQLQFGPENTYGKWTPASSESPATLKAIPFVPKENTSVTLHMLGLAVKRADNAPIVVLPGSRFVVRGRLTTATDVYFGIWVVRPNGEFAGKFRCRRLATNFRDESQFEAVFPLDEFGLDPCVWDRKDELASKPDGLVVTGAWSFTHAGGPTGLEITEVELISPDPVLGSTKVGSQ
ncbi:MAG: FecR family protein [Planctomycetota bacterium]|nr:FecR family protein [Planctomycetota bacterium]